MVVQHNLTAMNSSRQLGIVTNQQAKQSEKLASGYRINRAGDDAAGLKISEKMRSQIRGLQKASTNAQDGVSLIQTAEGALNEAHSILQRMNELAVQGANDTNEGIDRDAINEELAALTEELDRIATTTQFNKQNLLDGSFTGKNLQVGANANQKITVSIGKMDAATLGLKSIQVAPASAAEAAKPQTGVSDVKIVYKNTSYTFNTGSSMAYNVGAAISTFKGTISGNANTAQYKLQFDGTSFYYIDSADNKYVSAGLAMAADISIAKIAVSNEITTNLDTYVKKSDATAASATVAAEGVPEGTAQTINVPKVDNYSTANATLTAVQSAINKVSSQRSALGAIQNRLEHTIANLDNVAENTQAAESRIRDTDMAAEMVEYSKNQILAQAGQSMLAQANQSTQGVLSLLQ